MFSVEAIFKLEDKDSIVGKNTVNSTFKNNS